MNARLKSFGFGKRKSANSIQSPDPNATPSQTPPPGAGPVGGAPQIPQQLPLRPGSIASTTSLSPMNHPGAPNRPPSYSANFPPGPGAPIGRTSPLTNQGPARTPPSQMVGGPPPINTGAPVAGYPPQLPPIGGGQPMGGPPGYGGAPGGYGAPPPQQGPPGGMGGPQYGARPGNTAEVEGNSRSKAQLIVGIDFASASRASAKHENMSNRSTHRAPLSLALPSPLRPTTRPRRTLSPNGQVRGRTTSKRYRPTQPKPKPHLCRSG